MSITVRDALNIGALKHAELIGWSGLDNLITSVSVVEIPDAVEWYRGNALQITAFYSIADNVRAQLRLINNLAEHKCSALVICHSAVWVKNIAPEVIDLANRLNFPLIKVSSETA